MQCASDGKLSKNREYFLQLKSNANSDCLSLPKDATIPNAKNQRSGQKLRHTRCLLKTVLTLLLQPEQQVQAEQKNSTLSFATLKNSKVG